MTFDLAPALRLLRQEVPGLAGIYLFGSHANGYARGDSDVDLAVYAATAIAPERCHDLALRLGSVLSRDVDLIDLAQASTILQMQVIGEGRLVDVLDAEAVGLFEVRVMRDYHELKARRAGIEADVVRRGRIYA